jgi:hypothetical protein
VLCLSKRTGVFVCSAGARQWCYDRDRETEASIGEPARTATDPDQIVPRDVASLERPDSSSQPTSTPVNQTASPQPSDSNDFMGVTFSTSLSTASPVPTTSAPAETSNKRKERDENGEHVFGDETGKKQKTGRGRRMDGDEV